MNGLSLGSVKRPVTTFMILLIALALGIVSVLNLQLDLFPNMNIPYAIVMTTYTGAGSQEMESLVTEKLEERLSTLSGLDTISSQSSEGLSVVILKFNSDVNIDLAAVDIREQVDIAKYFLPDDAGDPTVIKIDVNSMISLRISATCEGMDINELGEMIEDKVVNRLERLNGVASVTLMGKKEKEVKVVINEEKLRGYGIAESTITGLLASENATTPMGSIDRGNKKLSIRVKGEYETLEEIRNLPITTGSGAVITLGEVATVTQEYEEKSSIAKTNGEDSINLAIQKQSNANTSSVSALALAELEKIKAEMPEVEFLVITDPADSINESVSNVFTSLVQGMLFAILVLFIFLRNVRSTLIVSISMPLSVVSTFALMYFTGMSLNLMSLGGITLGVGMLVDNSIVVLESIYKKIEEGLDSKTAAIEGSREVGLSVFASTLTTVAVFLPVLMVKGTIGELFRDLSLTVAFSLSASMVVALTFVPMACSIFIHPEDVGNIHTSRNPITMLFDLIGAGLSALEAGYKHLLSACLKHKPITMLVVIIFFVGTCLVAPFIEFDFMPSSDEGSISIDVQLPSGSNLDTVSATTDKVLGLIDGYPEIKNISYSAGGSGVAAVMGASGDSASINIDLVDKKQRSRSTDEIVDDMREKVKDVAGADITITAQSTSMGGSSSGGDLTIKIIGDEFDKLSEIGDNFVDRLSNVNGLVNVKSSVDEAAPQTTIKVNREKAKSYGITSAAISSVVRTAISGSTATTYKIDGDEYDVNVVRDSEQVDNISDIENLLIPTAMGENVPLSEVVTIISETAPTTITREDQKNYINVTANAGAGVSTSSLEQIARVTLGDFIMPDGYTWEFGGQSESMRDGFIGLAVALLASVFLLYMIMASQFEAFAHPFIIMFAIPIAITGGIMGLFIAGETLSVTSFLGFIMLAGVVVNNGIVLIDYANLLRRERGMDVTQSMKIAGPSRLRPVLMSTLTTVLGLLPMMLSQASGSERMKGLATTVVFGLSLSTLVTLLFVPTAYVALTSRIERAKARREAKRAAKRARVEAQRAVSSQNNDTK